VGETKIKAKLSPALAGAWAELGKIRFEIIIIMDIYTTYI
jgi:hypothetical protein